MLKCKSFQVGNYFEIGGEKLTLIGGPCAIENEEMCFEVAETVLKICQKLDINYVFKGSFDKANRSYVNAGRGVGMEKGLEILEKIKKCFNIPVTTDVHESYQCEPVGSVVDILQIPAYLCRQTDLISESAKTGKVVNIKKGQFMAPWDMKKVVDKMLAYNNEKIILCERGTTFGYNRLVVDMMSLTEMRKIGYPVFIDATHSVQYPGSNAEFTGGNREFVPYLMNASVSIGVDGIFAEIHPNPDKAISDGPSQLKLSTVDEILTNAVRFNNLRKEIEK